MKGLMKVGSMYILIVLFVFKIDPIRVINKHIYNLFRSEYCGQTSSCVVNL